MRRRAAAALATVAAATTVAAVSAAPQRDLLVRPGVSVGKIRLGMSEAQLRRAVGRPSYVVGRTRVFGGVRLEYQYGLNGEYSVVLRGRAGSPRVVSVATFLRRERLPNGIGVGSRPKQLRAAFGPRLRCTPYRTFVQQSRTYITGNSTCSVAGRTGATVFLLTLDPGYLTPAESDKARVIEVGVRTT